ncbi:hypothetical protein [Bartonella machadoae]|uniref:hypothetical protein n=1 Tax=Bartonella machadoae TaxID=2893471 RepID=UPI001F4CA330|nr:hypothetical protein [Bartonella machadoae]UNE54601.1 hypothetical protein LNM86_01475 [Bartonella machadoae]
MNPKYFITTFATFFSISVAQGGSLKAVQKRVEGIPSSVFPNEQGSYSLSKAFQAKFSCLDNDQQQQAVKLVPVSSSAKRKGPRSGRKGGRPSLFRGPMSF